MTALLRDPKIYTIPSGPGQTASSPAVLGITMEGGRSCVVAGANDVVMVFDGERGEEFGRWCYGAGVDGEEVIVDLGEAKNNRIHDIAQFTTNTSLNLLISGSDSTFRHYSLPFSVFGPYPPTPSPSILRVQTFQTPSTAFSLACSSSGDFAFAGCADGSILQFNVSSGQITKNLIGHGPQPVWDLWWTNGRIYSACFDRTVAEWDVMDETKQEPRRVWRFGEGVNSVCILDVARSVLAERASIGRHRRSSSEVKDVEFLSMLRRDRDVRLLDDDRVGTPGVMGVTIPRSSVPRSSSYSPSRRGGDEFEEDTTPSTFRHLLVGLERGNIVELDITEDPTITSPLLSSIVSRTPPDSPVSFMPLSPPSLRGVEAASMRSRGESMAVWASPTSIRRMKATRPVLHVGHTGFVTSIQSTGESGWFLSGSEDGTVRLWCVGSGGKRSGSGRILHSQKVPGNEIYSLSLMKVPRTLGPESAGEKEKQMQMVAVPGRGGRTEEGMMVVLVPGGGGLVREVVSASAVAMGMEE
ncbi:hypothetical protein HDU67_010070 [Dinochytrium kinnereticum]|nr:hypothetical protein HDU67_010070 [Dinochytrium kinnereticum]